MEMEDIDFNKYIKLEVIIEDEAFDSTESQSIDVELQSESSFLRDLSLAQSECERNGISDQITGSKEIHFSTADLVKECKELSRIDRVAVNGSSYSYSEEPCRVQTVLEGKKTYFSPNGTQNYVSSVFGEGRFPCNELNPVVVLQHLCSSRLNSERRDEYKPVSSFEEFKGTMQFTSTNTSAEDYYNKMRNDKKSCSTMKSNEEELKNGTTKLEGETSERLLTDKGFRKKIRVTDHSQLRLKREFHICKVCNKTFLHASELNRHISIHTGIKPYTCISCSKSFRLKWYLQEHQKVHSIEKTFSCRECPKSFKWEWSLKVHERGHIQALQFGCQVCGRSFKRKDRLRDHIAHIHMQFKPYICAICTRSFSTRNAIRGHKKVHANQDTFVCDVCKKTYTLRYKFLAHLKCHNLKNYVCSYCSRRFTHHQSMKRHLLTHDKKYTCPVCKRSFARIDSLDDHMNHHTMKLSYRCDVCKREFWSKNNIRFHMLKHLGTRYA